MTTDIATSLASATSDDPVYTRLQDDLERNEMARDLVSGLMAMMCPRTDSVPFARWDVTTTPDTEERRKTSLVAFALGIFGYRRTLKEESDIRTLIQTTDFRLLGYPIRIAAEKGNAFFLNTCMDHPTLTKSEKLSLFAAAGDLLRVKALLESEGSISKDDAGKVFIVAARHNHSEILELLLEKMGIGNGEGQISRDAAGSALESAAAKNCIHALTFLLDRISVGTGENQIGRCPAGRALEKAAEKNCTAVLSLLLEKIGVGPNTIHRRYAGNALFNAADGNHLEALTLLLDRLAVGNGENLIPKEDAGWALQTTADNNYLEALTLLLNRLGIGNGVNQISKKDAGEALEGAAENNQPEALSLLLDRLGVENQISKETAASALQKAASKNSVQAIALILNRLGVGTGEGQVSTEGARNAIHIAQDLGHSAAALLILEHLPTS